MAANPHPFEDTINVFGDDLFRYLLPRRVSVDNLMQPVARPPGTREVFFPEVGITILCECFRRQREFIMYFQKYYPDFVQDNRSFMTFCATYAVRLINEHGADVLPAARTIAAMVLELGVFCHVRGHPSFKYYGGFCWSDIFKFYLSFPFFSRHNWNDFLEIARVDVIFYRGNDLEVVLDDGRVEYKTDWLRTFDYGNAIYYPGVEREPIRIRTPTPTEEATLAEAYLLEHSLETVTVEAPVQGEILPTDDVSIPTPRQPDSGPEKSADPVEKKRQPIAEFKRLVLDGDSPSELLEILENKKRMEVLMKSGVFLRMVRDTVENPAERMNNQHILEFMRLILMGNEDLARYFARANHYLTMTNQIRSTMETLPGSDELASGSGIQSSSASADGTRKPDVSSQSDEVLGAIPKRRKRTAADRTRRINKTDEKLVQDFKRIVSTGGDPAGNEICDNFDFPFSEKVLLKSEVFRSIMELTVKFPVRRWSNDWILSFVKALIGGSVIPSSPTKVKSSDRPLRMPGAISTPAEGQKDSEVESEQSKDIPVATSDGTPGQSRADDTDSVGSMRVLDSDEDSDDDSKPENTVYVDIVNLSTTFKQLLVDVVKEGSATRAAEEQGQEKTKSRKKRKNRKRSRKNKPQMAPEPEDLRKDERPQAEDVGKAYEPPLQPSAKAMSEDYSPHAECTEDDVFRVIQSVATLWGTGQNMQQLSEEARNRCPFVQDLARRTENPTTPAEPKDLDTGSRVVVTAADSSTTPRVTGGASALGGEAETEDPGEESGEDGSEMSLQQLFDIIPSSRSDEVLDWIFRQILARKPNFFEILQNTNIDEATKQELLKYKEKFSGQEE